MSDFSRDLYGMLAATAIWFAVFLWQRKVASKSIGEA